MYCSEVQYYYFVTTVYLVCVCVCVGLHFFFFFTIIIEMHYKILNLCLQYMITIWNR